MSMCRVFSCVVGRGCLLWPVHSLGKTLLAFALLHSVLQGEICLLLQVFLNFLLLHSSLLQWKGPLFWVLVLKGLVGLHKTVQLQLLQHYWSEYRLGLLWYWMVCLGNEQRSFCLDKRLMVLSNGRDWLRWNWILFWWAGLCSVNLSSQFSVDRWGCVPSLGPNYGGGNEIGGEIGLDKITKPEHVFRIF